MQSQLEVLDALVIFTMSYLAAVKVAIVVTVLLTQQAVRLLENKNGALHVENAVFFM